MPKRENVGTVSTQISALMGWKVGSAVWFPAKLEARLAIADPEWAIGCPGVAREVLANPSYFGQSAKGELVAVGDSWGGDPALGPIRYAVYALRSAPSDGGFLEIVSLTPVDSEWLAKANRSKDILSDGLHRATKWLDSVSAE